MSTKSISMCEGKGSLSHNNREFTAKNIDPLRTPDNIVFVQQDLGETYHQLFDEAVRISLNMKYNQIIDPKNICRNITGLGRWGNGDVELFFEHTNEIDDVMQLIEQSFNLQNDS